MSDEAAGEGSKEQEAARCTGLPCGQPKGTDRSVLPGRIVSYVRGCYREFCSSWCGDVMVAGTPRAGNIIEVFHVGSWRRSVVTGVDQDRRLVYYHLLGPDGVLTNVGFYVGLAADVWRWLPGEGEVGPDLPSRGTPAPGGEARPCLGMPCGRPHAGNPVESGWVAASREVGGLISGRMFCSDACMRAMEAGAPRPGNLVDVSSLGSWRRVVVADSGEDSFIFYADAVGEDAACGKGRLSRASPFWRWAATELPQQGEPWCERCASESFLGGDLSRGGMQCRLASKEATSRRCSGCGAWTRMTAVTPLIDVGDRVDVLVDSAGWIECQVTEIERRSDDVLVTYEGREEAGAEMVGTALLGDHCLWHTGKPRRQAPKDAESGGPVPAESEASGSAGDAALASAPARRPPRRAEIIEVRYPSGWERRWVVDDVTPERPTVWHQRVSGQGQSPPGVGGLHVDEEGWRWPVEEVADCRESRQFRGVFGSYGDPWCESCARWFCRMPDREAGFVGEDFKVQSCRGCGRLTMTRAIPRREVPRPGDVIEISHGKKGWQRRKVREVRGTAFAYSELDDEGLARLVEMDIEDIRWRWPPPVADPAAASRADVPVAGEIGPVALQGRRYPEVGDIIEVRHPRHGWQARRVRELRKKSGVFAYSEVEDESWGRLSGMPLDDPDWRWPEKPAPGTAQHEPDDADLAAAGSLGGTLGLKNPPAGAVATPSPPVPPPGFRDVGGGYFEADVRLTPAEAAKAERLGLSTTEEAPRSPIAEALRREIIDVVTRGDARKGGAFTAAVAIQVGKICAAAREIILAQRVAENDLSALLQRKGGINFGGGMLGGGIGGFDVLGDDDGVSPLAGAPAAENFGTQAIRQLVEGLRGMNDSPAKLVEALALARSQGLTDVAASLEKKLGVEPSSRVESAETSSSLKETE